MLAVKSESLLFYLAFYFIIPMSAPVYNMHGELSNQSQQLVETPKHDGYHCTTTLIQTLIRSLLTSEMGITFVNT